MQTSSEPIAEPPENPNDISVSDAETQSGDEHEPSDNVNDNVHVDAQPSNDKDEVPPTKIASQCLDEFDDFMFKQDDFNAYFGRQLKQNTFMIKRLSDYMADIRGELKLVSKHATMVTTQVEQVLKAQKEALDEMNSKKNDYAVRVATRNGRMTQEPLYP